MYVYVQFGNRVDYSAFIQEFRNWDSAWALEALYVVAYEIRILAEKVMSFHFILEFRML